VPGGAGTAADSGSGSDARGYRLALELAGSEFVEVVVLDAVGGGRDPVGAVQLQGAQQACAAVGVREQLARSKFQ
jgi:hypothetical protein